MMRIALQGKRIVIVLGHFELGGAERQALHLARYLKQEGAYIEVWGFNKHGEAAVLCDGYKIPWRVVQFFWTRNILLQKIRLEQFTRLIRLEKVDVLMPYTIFPNVICGLTWQKAKTRLCIWNQREEGMRFLNPGIEKEAVRRTPYFISNSEHASQFLATAFGIEHERIQVIHNGVELSRPEFGRQEWRKKLAVGDNAFLACMVANISRRKDHITLLKAWQKVCSRLPVGNAPVLVCAGRFDDTYDQLIDMLRELKLETQVRFIGYVKDISGLLSAVDLCVHSSFLEGCPNGVLECMAAGLAVVGTDIPGIREAVGEPGFQFLAPVKDDDTLSEKITRLIQDNELRLRIGAINALRIKEQFSVQKMCEATAAVISNKLRE